MEEILNSKGDGRPVHRRVIIQGSVESNVGANCKGHRLRLQTRELSIKYHIKLLTVHFTNSPEKQHHTTVPES